MGVSSSFHLIWPAIGQEHPLQTAYEQGTHAILALPSALYLNIVIEHLLDLAALEESPDQAASTKSAEVSAGEFFPHRGHILLAIAGLLRYPLSHLVSVSFADLVVLFIALLLLHFGGTLV
jgi:hypothetical protein